MQAGTVLYFLVFAGLFVLMMRFGCGAHIMGHGHGHGSAPGDNPGGARWMSPDSATDPVCGMAVKPANAKSAVYGGQVYYFCSPSCREKFEAAPASYAKSGDSLTKEKHHGCC